MDEEEPSVRAKMNTYIKALFNFYPLFKQTLPIFTETIKYLNRNEHFETKIRSFRFCS